MQPGAADATGVQNTDSEDKEHVGPREVKKEEQHAEKPQEPGRVFCPGFIQPGGNGFENLGADINRQNREKRPVQTNGQAGTEKIIAHDEDQDEQTRDQEAVVYRHFSQTNPSPEGKRTFRKDCVVMQTETLHL